MYREQYTNDALYVSVCFTWPPLSVVLHHYEIIIVVVVTSVSVVVQVWGEGDGQSQSEDQLPGGGGGGWGEQACKGQHNLLTCEPPA